MLSILFLQKSIVPLLSNVGSILYIRVDRVGDMVLSTPAFRAIKAALPRVHLTVMASPANAPILKNNPDVDEVIVYDQSVKLPRKNEVHQRIEIQSLQFGHRSLYRL